MACFSKTARDYQSYQLSSNKSQNSIIPRILQVILISINKSNWLLHFLKAFMNSEIFNNSEFIKTIKIYSIFTNTLTLCAAVASALFMIIEYYLPYYSNQMSTSIPK